jgi:hypothetical protein
LKNTQKSRQLTQSVVAGVILKRTNMRYIKLIIPIAICCLLQACISMQSFKPIDRSESNFRNYMGLFVFELPQGQDWYELGTSGGATAFGKKLESKDHTFIASAQISKFTLKFSSPEEFLEFVKKSRIGDTDPDRFKIIRYEENIDKTHSEFCTKFILKAEDNGKGILESHGYTCLHPSHPELVVTLEYSERTKSEQVSQLVRNEGERFISSLELKK